MARRPANVRSDQVCDQVDRWILYTSKEIFPLTEFPGCINGKFVRLIEKFGCSRPNEDLVDSTEWCIVCDASVAARGVL